MEWYWILLFILGIIIVIILIIVIAYYSRTSASQITITPLTIFSNGIQLPTAGGTPSTFNYYETGSFKVTYSGAAVGTAIWQFVRDGNIVTVNIPNFTSAFVTATNLVVTGYPSILLPKANSVNCSLITVDNNTVQTLSGKIAIPTAGTLTIYKTFNINTTFTGPGNVGHDSCSFTYNVN